MIKIKKGDTVSVKVPVGGYKKGMVLDPSMKAKVIDIDRARRKMFVEFYCEVTKYHEQIWVEEGNLILHRKQDDYKPGEIEKKFKQFEKQLEASKNAWQRLRASERAFDKLRDELIELPEWEEWCKEKGWATDLTFGELGA